MDTRGFETAPAVASAGELDEAGPDALFAAGLAVAALGVGFAGASFVASLAVAAFGAGLAGAAFVAGFAVDVAETEDRGPAFRAARAGRSRTDTASDVAALFERTRAARAAAEVTRSPIFWTSPTTRATALSSCRVRFLRFRPVSLARSS
ncbi:MAG TPA: hypothetical protein VIM30_10960 [Candidatus Limnocylindrales bacterium]